MCVYQTTGLYYIHPPHAPSHWTLRDKPRLAWLASPSFYAHHFAHFRTNFFFLVILQLTVFQTDAPEISHPITARVKSCPCARAAVAALLFCGRHSSGRKKSPPTLNIL